MLDEEVAEGPCPGGYTLEHLLPRTSACAPQVLRWGSRLGRLQGVLRELVFAVGHHSQVK